MTQKAMDIVSLVTGRSTGNGRKRSRKLARTIRVCVTLRNDNCKKWHFVNAHDVAHPVANEDCIVPKAKSRLMTVWRTPIVKLTLAEQEKVAVARAQQAPNREEMLISRKVKIEQTNVLANRSIISSSNELHGSGKTPNGTRAQDVRKFLIDLCHVCTAIHKEKKHAIPTESVVQKGKSVRTV
jgi:hypothetical protein